MMKSTNILGNFIEAIATTHIHGSSDDDIYKDGELILDNQNERDRKFMSPTDQLVCSCRYLSYTVSNYLRTKNGAVRSRAVEFISQTDEDTRHVGLELYIKYHPVYVDPDLGLFFLYNNKFLDALRLQLLLCNDKLADIQIIQTINRKTISPDFPYAETYGAILQDRDSILAWYKQKAAGVQKGLNLFIAEIANKEKVLANVVDSKRHNTHSFIVNL